MSVLPYNGDSRGTQVHGPVVLEHAEIAAHDRQRAKLQLTTDAGVRTLPHATAPADAYTWVDYADASPADIAAATALRVVVTDLVSGNDSIGRLSMTLGVPDSLSGDVLATSVSGSLKNGSILLPDAEPAIARVMASEVSDVIWDDANGDGLRDDGEHTLPDVTVVVSRGGVEIGRQQTDAHGVYEFTDLTSGTVTVSVDRTSLPVTAGAWRNTASPSGGSDGVSGDIELGRGGSATGQHFGFQNLIPRVQLTKEGIAPKVPVPGEPLTWQFTVENFGNTELTDVAIRDDLADLSAIEFGAWPDPAKPGVLQPGEQVLATATSPLTQAQLDAGAAHNTATVTALSSVVPDPITDDAEASVPVAGFSTISLEKTASVQNVPNTADAVAGDTAEYAFVVRNTGTLTLTDVTIADPLPGMSTVAFGAWPDPAATGRLAPGESVSATATLELTQAHIEQAC